jgi:hypothetical protein
MRGSTSEEAGLFAARHHGAHTARGSTSRPQAVSPHDAAGYDHEAGQRLKVRAERTVSDLLSIVHMRGTIVEPPIPHQSLPGSGESLPLSPRKSKVVRGRKQRCLAASRTANPAFDQKRGSPPQATRSRPIGPVTSMRSLISMVAAPGRQC